MNRQVSRYDDDESELGWDHHMPLARDESRSFSNGPAHRIHSAKGTRA